MKQELLEGLLHVESQDELVAKTQEIVQQLGFRHFVFALRLLPRDGHRTVDLLMGTYPADYLERYGRQNYVAVDPVVAHALQSTWPLIWSKALFAHPDAHDMYEDARTQGVSAGVSLSIHNALQGHIGLFGFANEADADLEAALIRERMPDIQLLAAYYHETYCRLLRETHPEYRMGEIAPQALDTCERDCLMWLSEGLDATAIASKLMIGESQVLNHLELARRKLGADSLPQAVARALLRGITEQPQRQPLVLVDADGRQIDGRHRLALRLQQQFQQQSRQTLLILGIDRFERLRDSLGQAGSTWLATQAIARLLAIPFLANALIPLEEQCLALLPSDKETPESYARAAQEALLPPFQLAGRDYHLTLAVGIACAPDDGNTPQMLVDKAEQALHQAHLSGPGSVVRFSVDAGRCHEEEFAIELRLHHALNHLGGGLAVHYQPIVDTAGDRVIGFEALCRWRDEQLGPLPPDRFIPIAERSGLIVPLGTWVLEQALAQLAGWHATGLDLFVAVNVSAVQFRDPGFVDLVLRTLARHGLPAQALELEITESLLLEHPDALAGLERLRAAGIHLAIDDFGTGYSSFGYLQRMPISILKLDQSFVRDAHCSPRNATLVEAALRMARGLDLTVVAEGVESAEDRDFLARLGCDRWQGFLCSRPAAADDARLCRLLDPPAAV
jgi:EAL domain-containing protein (putative c-di-GMP-specific phosphodiesterase class I)/GGDEF domain-containing protein